MAKNTWYRTDGSKMSVLYCGTYRRNGKAYCTPHAIPIAVLEGIVLDDLRRMIQSKGDIGTLLKMRSCITVDAGKSRTRDVKRVKSELERIKRLKKSVYEDYKEDLLSKEEFLSYRREYLKKEELFSGKLIIMEEKRNEEVEEVRKQWMKSLTELRNISKLDRIIVAEMIDEIKIYENQRIKITYNFEANKDVSYRDSFDFR